jgi:hypothetical protein
MRAGSKSFAQAGWTGWRTRFLAFGCFRAAAFLSGFDMSHFCHN